METNQPFTYTAAEITVEQTDDDTLTVYFSGDWKIDQPQPEDSELRNAIESRAGIRQLQFNTDNLQVWDSSLLTFLVSIRKMAKTGRMHMDTQGLPEGARRLMHLSAAVPKREGAEKVIEHEPLLSRIGSATIGLTDSLKGLLHFFGDACIAFLKFTTGRARYRRAELWLIIQEVGAEALPIVSLISILIGLILAYVGAVQLAQFGAQIYVADLVAIGMLREMGAMMTGIIMAGRTGAAFAAQLGTMQVNEEIDALQTLGIPPIEFLVLPRMIALIVMMPLLCVYSNLMGIFGGAAVAIGAFDLTPVAYFEQTSGSITMNHFLIGIVKSVVFGIVIALAGCLRGMQSGRSATAVGYAATSAVVTSIVAIVALDGLFAVFTNILGI